MAQAQTLQSAQLLRVRMGHVNGYVLIRGKEIGIVDTGTYGNEEKFAEAIRTAGLSWDAVHHVILTHYHTDHIGSVGEVLRAAVKATAYAGAADIPRVESYVYPPPGKAPRPFKAVNDTDEVFGLRVIETPGHTPGHVSVFDPAGSLLIVGDALTNLGNKINFPRPEYTADMAQAHQSAKKLAQIRFERAVFGHGEPIDKGASQVIAKLVSTL